MGLPHTYSHPNIQESGHLWIFILWIGLESNFHVFCPGKRNGHCCDILNSSGNPESLEPWNLVGYKIGSYPWYTGDYHNPYNMSIMEPQKVEKNSAHIFSMQPGSTSWNPLSSFTGSLHDQLFHLRKKCPEKDLTWFCRWNIWWVHMLNRVSCL